MVSNNNKKSAPVFDLTIEFFFPYVISKVEGEPVLDSGGDITVGGLKVVETEGNRATVTEKLPVGSALDKLLSLESQTYRQGDNLVRSNTAVFFCREWPEIAGYKGSIVVDLTRKPSIVQKVHEIGRFTGKYYYKIGEKKFTGKLKGSIPEVNLTIKLAEHHYLKGRQYTGREEFKLAVTEYDEAIKLYPEYVRGYFHRGYAYLKNREYEKAISDWDRVIVLSPKYADAYFNRASAKAELRRYDEAIVDYSRYIGMKPTDPEVYFRRAFAYAFKGQYEKSILDSNKALALNLAPERHSELAKVYFNGGNFYDRQSKFPQAKECYDKAIELNANYADAYNNRGNVYRRGRHYDEAISDYTRAIRLDPTLHESYANRAFAYKALGELGKAAKDFKKACNLGVKKACEEYQRLESK